MLFGESPLGGKPIGINKQHPHQKRKARQYVKVAAVFEDFFHVAAFEYLRYKNHAKKDSPEISGLSI
jgi:hypothetical protein